jgi:hypothetical protein
MWTIIRPPFGPCQSLTAMWDDMTPGQGAGSAGTVSPVKTVSLRSRKPSAS